MLDITERWRYYISTMTHIGEFAVPSACSCGPMRRLVEHADELEEAKKASTDEAFDQATLDYVAEQLHEVGGLSEADARIMAVDKHGDYLKLVAERLDLLDEQIAACQSIGERLTSGCAGRLRVETIDNLGRRVILYVCSSPLIDALDHDGVEPVVVERIN
jgi:hypothetical protein